MIQASRVEDTFISKYGVEIEVEDVSCPLGCARSDRLVLSGRDLLHGLPGEFDVVRCASCGLMRTNSRPTAKGMAFYYPENYGPYLGTRITADMVKSTSDNNLIGKGFSFLKNVFGTKSKPIPPLKPGKMLEIGCASGSFLNEMRGKGWEVEGIEFSENAAIQARLAGLNVISGPLENINRSAACVDLVVGWMVLEHLHNPVEGLKKLANWSKKGATLVASVPDAGSREFRVFGKYWYALQLPTHLFHYDVSSIEKVLSASGWRLVKVQHHRSLANLVASLGNFLCSRGFERIGRRFVAFPEKGGRLGVLALWIPSSVMASIGQTGRMTVWAEKV